MAMMKMVSNAMQWVFEGGGVKVVGGENVGRQGGVLHGWTNQHPAMAATSLLLLLKLHRNVKKQFEVAVIRCAFQKGR